MKIRSVMVVAALLYFSSAALAREQYRDALVPGVPHVRQRDDFCGEACAEMVLRKLGKAGDQNYVFNMSGLDPVLGRGCYSADLARALTQVGFKTGDVFYSVNVNHADEEIENQWRLMHADLLRGVPSIVCMHYDASPQTAEHMRLIVGYDSRTDSVTFLDPADRSGQHQQMARDKFLALWPLKYEAAKWLIVRFRMEPKDIKEQRPALGFSNADYSQHILALKKKMPADFSVCIERPFVVVGNGPREDVERISRNTVRWAVERLKADYFTQDPAEIITIWLFKDDESYRHYATKILGDTPTTPYGYYAAAHRALVMNISTGTGTLVHEIVHPYVRANFLRCPAWFNEGLGSLYEQCGERDGHIVGYLNWRLPGLQKAIQASSVPTFAELTATTDTQFYGEDKGTNYAEARYLCYYLQEQGRLQQFYRAFLANQDRDPTGYATLVKTLGEDDMDAFQTKWQKFVMGIQGP